MKKFLVLFLALAMLLSSTAIAETSMPITEEPLKMTMMIKLDTARGYDPTQNAAFKYLEELTGIEWEYRVVDNSAWSETLSLMWANNEDMPDFIYNGVGDDDLLLYTGKLIVDVAPYLEEYAPNFNALYQSNEDVRKAVTLPGGKIGSFCWTNMEIEAGAGKCPNEMLYINQEWLDALGLPMPQTVEEYYNTLIAFRDQDPNGNGEKDEIALAPRNAYKDLKSLQPLFGFMLDNNLYMDGDTVKFGPFMDEYKEYVKFCHQLYAEGLIDADTFVMKAADITAKGNGEVQRYGSLITAAAFTNVGNDNASAFVTTPIYTAANGNQMWWGRSYATPGVGVITTACENVEAVIRWCDLFYSEEYRKLVWMGEEGVAYKNNDDGTWEWIYSDEYPDTTSVRASLTIQAGGQGPSMCPPEWFNLNDANEAPANAQRKQIANDYGDALRVAMPKIYYESAAAKERSILNSDINSYVDPMFASFVTGELDIDENWDAFIAQLKMLDADHLAELAQDAYDAAK